MDFSPPDTPVYQQDDRTLVLRPARSPGGFSLPQNQTPQENYQSAQFSPFPQYQYPLVSPQSQTWMIPGGYISWSIDGSQIQSVQSPMMSAETWYQQPMVPSPAPSPMLSAEQWAQSQMVPNLAPGPMLGAEQWAQPQMVPNLAPSPMLGAEQCVQPQMVPNPAPSPTPSAELGPQQPTGPNQAPNNKAAPQKRPVLSSVPNIEAPRQTSTTIIRHICAKCGRQRSPMYHQEHPIIPGELPGMAFCKKCCKDETSSAESDASSRKHVSRGLDRAEKNPRNKPKTDSKPKADAILKLKRGDTKKDSTSQKHSTRYDQPETPPSTKMTGAAGNNTTFGGHRTQARRQGFGAQLQDAVGYLRGRERSSPVHVHEGQSSSMLAETEGKFRTLLSSAHHEELGRKGEKLAPTLLEKRNAREHNAHESSSLARPKKDRARLELKVPKYSQEAHESQRPRGYNQGVFEASNREKSAAYSEKSARRRRLEHSLSESSFESAEDAFRDELRNDLIVVTEHYARRPKKTYESHEEVITSRRPKQVDNAAAPHLQLLTEPEQSHYSKSRRLQQRPKDPQIRQRVPQDEISSDNSYTSESDVDSRDDDTSSSSALPVGASARSLSHSQQQKSAYLQAESGRVLGEERGQYPSDRGRNNGSRSQPSVESNHRPPYVRDASDRESEKAPVPSPRPNKSRFPPRNYSEGNRVLDQAERRVTFQGLEGSYLSRDSESTSTHSLKEAQTWYRNK